MSEQSGELPSHVVKVEVEEDDERNRGITSNTMQKENREDDKDMEMLKAVASLLSNGPRFSSGTEEGENLTEKLLNLGERLVGLKEWEGLGLSKQEKNRELAQRLEEAELQFEMVKESKSELRKTYDLEMDRRIKAERDVAELRKKIAPKSGTEVLPEVNLKTDSKALLQEGKSGEEENMNKHQLAKEADCSSVRREYCESSGGSSDSDNGGSDTDSDDDIRRSGPKLSRKIGEKPMTEVLQQKPVVHTRASNDPYSSIGVHQQADHAMQVTAAGIEVRATPQATTSEKKNSMLQEQEVSGPSSDEIVRSSVQEVTGSDKTVIVDDGAQKTSYNLRRRSGESHGGRALIERVDSEASGEDIDDVYAVDHTATPQRNRQSSGRTSEGGDERFKCEKCGAVVGSQKNLNRHTKTIHGVKEKRGKFPCYCCNNQFLYNSKLFQHLKTHPKNESYKCKTCGVILKARSIFKSHLKIHDPDVKKKYVCSTCFKPCITSQNLSHHLATHRSERPFKCPQCPQRFKLPGILKKHLVVHSERKPFQCELCDKIFKRSFELVMHIRVHTGERPYACQVCKKTFTQASNLNTHMSTHQGEERKRHPCPFCHRKFAHNTHCRRHQRHSHKSEWASVTSNQDGSK